MRNKIITQLKAYTAGSLLLLSILAVNGCGSSLRLTKEANTYRISWTDNSAPVQQNSSQEAVPEETTEKKSAPEESGPISSLPQTKEETQSLEATEESVLIKEGVTVAHEVKGRSGLIPIQESSEEIKGNVAEESKASNPGQTGEELSFDPLFYPYYSMLDSPSQAVYKQIYANASDLIPVFTPVADVTPEHLGNIFEAVYNDHPELFWLDNSYSYKYQSNGICVEVSLNFNETADNLSSARELFYQASESILKDAETMENDYDKELYVHDALVKQVDYVTNAPLNQSPYSALVYGRTVCSGYARAFQYLLHQLEIPCYLSTGYSSQNHAWNIVKLGEGYYNVDVTWNDTNSGIYDFFNKTDKDFKATHMRQGMSIYLPSSNGGEYDGIAPDLRPAPEEFGLTEDEALFNLEEYYTDCYAQIRELGKGSIEFVNLIPASLWKTVENAYNTKDYRSGYADRVMKDTGATSYQVSIEAEELKGDYCLLRHTIRIE